MAIPFESIPIVDISGLYSEDLEDRKAVAANMRDAAENTGFMYITGHHVGKKTISDLREATEAFFALQEVEKMKYYIGESVTHKGYVPEGEEILIGSSQKPDHKEAMVFGPELPMDDPLVKKKTPFYGYNLWPSGIPDFQSKVMKYFDECFALGKVLTRGFSLALGLDEQALAHYFSNPLVILRLIHYPLDESAEDAPGIGEHTDYEWFTILLANEPGLQVLNSDDKWIEALPVPDSFVINIGNTLELMTNSRFIATAHRVRKVKEERYSFPMFFGSNYDIKIAPLPEFVHEETKSDKTFNAVTYGDHLWTSVMRTYRYLIEKQKNGLIDFPDDSVAPLTAFGPAGLHRTTAAKQVTAVEN